MRFQSAGAKNMYKTLSFPPSSFIQRKKEKASGTEREVMMMMMCKKIGREGEMNFSRDEVK